MSLLLPPQALTKPKYVDKIFNYYIFGVISHVSRYINDNQALYNLLSLSFSKKMDYHAALCYPSDSAESLHNFDQVVWDYLQAATGLTLPQNDTGGGFECVLQLPINSLSG